MKMTRKYQLRVENVLPKNRQQKDGRLNHNYPIKGSLATAIVVYLVVLVAGDPGVGVTVGKLAGGERQLKQQDGQHIEAKKLH